MTITVPVNNLLFKFLLDKGALAWAGLPHVDMSFLGLITYIGVIAAMVQVLEMVLDRYFPGAVQRAGYFPAADHGELRDPGRVAVHGGAHLRLQRERGVWSRRRHRLGTGRHRTGGYSRES